MVTLMETGAYLVNGTEVVADTADAAALIKSKTGLEVVKEEALKNTIAYGILEAHNIPHCRFHDLRHANASIMLMLGVPDKYAMERLGHATNSTLKNVYQHTMDAEKLDIASRINAYFEALDKDS